MIVTKNVPNLVIFITSPLASKKLNCLDLADKDRMLFDKKKQLVSSDMPEISLHAQKMTLSVNFMQNLMFENNSTSNSYLKHAKTKIVWSNTREKVEPIIFLKLNRSNLSKSRARNMTLPGNFINNLKFAN